MMKNIFSNRLNNHNCFAPTERPTTGLMAVNPGELIISL